MIMKIMKTAGIAAMLLLCNATAKAQNVINYFYMKGEVCPPVTLSTSDGNLTVSNGDRLDGNIRIYSATDCNGNKILDLSADKTSTGTGQPTVREYIFSTLYSSNNNDDSGESTYSHDNQYEGGSYGNNVGNTVINGVNTLTEGFKDAWRDSQPIAGYPYLGLDLGASRMYGEFARLQCCLGGDAGFQLYGGIGKDWIFNGDNKEKTLWHAGLGYYMVCGYYENQQFDFGITYSETAVMKGGAISCDLSYRYFFGRTKRFGIYAGAGFGVGNVKEAFEERAEDEEFPGKAVWDIQVGFCIKLFATKD